MSHLSAADAASSTESKGPEEGRNDEEDDPGCIERVYDRVEDVDSSPHGQVFVSDKCEILSARVEAFGCIICTGAIVFADLVVIASRCCEAPVKSHEGTSDDQGS